MAGLTASPPRCSPLTFFLSLREVVVVVLWALVRVTGQARVRAHSRRSYRGRATLSTVMVGVLFYARLVAGRLWRGSQKNIGSVDVAPLAGQ